MAWAPRRSAPPDASDFGVGVHGGQGVAEIFGHVGGRAEQGQAARAVAGKLDPPPQTDQEGQVVGHVGRRDRRRRAVARRAGLLLAARAELAQLLQQCRQVDHTQLARAGVAHAEQLAVGRGGHAPRIGRAEIDVVQEHRVEQPSWRPRR